MFRLYDLVIASGMIGALEDAFTALLGFFKDVFTMITSADVVPWIIIGVAISVVSVCIKFFRRITWGA